MSHWRTVIFRKFGSDDGRLSENEYKNFGGATRTFKLPHQNCISKSKQMDVRGLGRNGRLEHDLYRSGGMHIGRCKLNDHVLSRYQSSSSP